MKENKIDAILLGISITGFALTAFSFLLLFVDNIKILLGALFWGGLLLGTIFQLILAGRRKKFFAAYGASMKKMQKARCGLLTFGSNRGAIIADYSLLLSVVALVVAFLLKLKTHQTEMFCYMMKIQKFGRTTN